MPGLGLHHLLVNARPWGPSPLLAAIESSLRAHGSRPIHVRWDRYEYEDGAHFTRRSHARFCAWVGRQLDPRARWLVLTDSTIGWHGAEALCAALPAGSMVDAVNGSGFVARASERLHLRARLRAHPRGAYDKLLVIAGWNDEGLPHTDAAVRGVVRAWMAYRADASEPKHASEAASNFVKVDKPK